MPKAGKNYTKAAAACERKLYPLQDAVDLLKKISFAKFNETVEVSMRQTESARIYFLLNHQNASVRIQFYKPMHDFLTDDNLSGNYDMPPRGVLILDEHYTKE